MATPKNRDTKEDMLDGCLKMFLQKSYGLVTVDDIVLFSGYTRRTVYHYFKDKNELFIAVVDRFMQKLLDYFEHFNQVERSSFLDYIWAYIEHVKILGQYVRAMTDNKVSSHLNLMLEASVHYPNFQDKARLLFDLEQNSWEKNIRLAIDRKEIRADIDVALTATKFRCMNTGINYQSILILNGVYINMLQLLMVDSYNNIKNKPTSSADILGLF